MKVIGDDPAGADDRFSCLYGKVPVKVICEGVWTLLQVTLRVTVRCPLDGLLNVLNGW